MKATRIIAVAALIVGSGLAPQLTQTQAGEALFIPAGTIHAAKNVGTGNAAELATYIVEKGKPLLVLAK